MVALVLLLLGTTIATVQFKVPTIMGNIMDQFSMSAAAASWLMSIFTFAGIILALPTGALAKKYGPKNMLLVAVSVAVIGALMGAFSNSGALLIVSRGVEGVALIFVTVCGPLAVQKYVAPDKIGAATGIWAIWVCLGSVIGGILTPSLFAWTGFKGVWVIYALAAVVAAVLVAVIIKEPGKSVAKSVADAAASSPRTEAAARVGYSELFTAKTVLFFIGFGIFNLVLLSVLAFSPTWMQVNGISKTLSGFISTLPMLLAVISSPLFGNISDRIGRRKPLLLLALVVMGPCAYLLLTSTGPMLWVGAIVMGLVGLGAPVMFLTSYINVLGRPELMSIGMGLLMLVQSLGQFLGTWVSSLLLGPSLSNWMTCGIGMLVLGLVGTGLTALCRYETAPRFQPGADVSDS
ncbi:MAG: CynX/NimT family MFS transporter [Coriobacteriia bacterium]